MIDTVENKSGKTILIIDNFEDQPPYQVMVNPIITGVMKTNKIPSYKTDCNNDLYKLCLCISIGKLIMITGARIFKILVSIPHNYGVLWGVGTKMLKIRSPGLKI
jgi:hypothetical protein